ncbi:MULTISPECIES: RNA polymerase sigma factor region1.1 domain-containing protein [Bradyrhizobium]|nr:RNA polymerase sigma factor region1.1 domain-containing protein [Bradyrhizobium diazoefficiens]MBP1061540.1 RNA polymerase primary sigma factor [Bradyrhizobium japonicum]AND94521.1 sigma-70 factor, region 1 [Bradyrhizobium diazoefficiens USDA 110]AWO95456.1 RNA polymerase subunit sigma-70 [Bradyrhizobium diazoefficiens]MBP1098186.1 RNA polymerase primary sigma factor [Bradyrhizobium japonicum]PDT56484.1 RNA polymerase subunit sigma-70 [Bradyrhizobium diazoefficiens]
MERRKIIQAAIGLGRRKGFVTFEQLNQLLPAATIEPKDIEAIMQALSDEGINLIDDDQA